MLSLLEEKNFEQVTVRNIAAQAGVGYATFYRHYPSREALLRDVSTREIGQLLAMTLPILFTEDGRSATRALCAYVGERRKLWTVLLTGGAAATLKVELLRQAQSLAPRGVKERTWLPGDLGLAYSVFATLELLAWWLRQADPPSVTEMAESLERLVVTPVRNSAGRTDLLPQPALARPTEAGP